MATNFAQGWGSGLNKDPSQFMSDPSYQSPYKAFNAADMGGNKYDMSYGGTPSAPQGFVPGAFDASAMSPGVANVAPMAGGGMFSGLGNKISEMFPAGMLGTTDAKGMKTDGWGGMALGVGQGLMNGYMGMQMYGLAKDTLENNKSQFAANFAEQKAANKLNRDDLESGRSGFKKAVA